MTITTAGRLCIAAIALGACGGSAKGPSYSRAMEAPGAPAPPADVSAADSGAMASLSPAATPGGPQGPQPIQVVSGPLLIYTANLTLAVFEATRNIDAVEQLARARNGYLVRRTNDAISIRVPAEIFHEVVAEIAGLGDVTHREINAQDVTDQFRDLETRLRNLHAVRDRLEALLAQAKNVQEALQVERELERVTAEIESIKGTLEMLGHLIAYSTINVAFQARPVERVDPIVELPFPWLQELGLQRLLRL
jgi:hypothetical protein